MGINISGNMQDLPEDIRHKADFLMNTDDDSTASLLPDFNDLMCGIVSEAEGLTEMGMTEKGVSDIVQEWKLHSRSLGRMLRVDDNGKIREGAGAQHLALEKLKAKLEEEGLFDQTRKLPLPFLPDKIGIITSPSGAVIRDMLSVFARKYFGVPVLIYPVPVQGKEAVPAICEAVAHMDMRENCSVLIVARGGGSFEELMPFK
ncbi:hypothetical protein CHS0354_006921 [Potamilus streckersoni]|uniref:Exonuclease VII large subunit C-terminal domain-containing protein n=1 Tax=Potamilus streckersoni TaxID=2493646 RepID=A0AAE0WD21_9BIVA|nr:hypothetical protein CHS0354_006921 [Potamilus streckersoni]